MSEVHISINREKVAVPKNTTILNAARMFNMSIPSLCYHPDQSIKANCRICMVEVKGGRRPVPACSTYVWDGMEIETNTKKLREMRKAVLELIMASHNRHCTTCDRNGTCELQELCRTMHIPDMRIDDTPALPVLDASSPIIRDRSKCVKCGRCMEACQNITLTHSGRSTDYSITTAYNMSLMDTPCIFCGQCSAVCPTGAIVERDDIQQVFNAIDDGKHVIVQVAEDTLPGEFAAEGAAGMGKLVAALHMLGINKVFDDGFAVNLQAIKETSEVIERIHHKDLLPVISICSAGLANYIEYEFPHLIGYVSTCKSSQQIFGALSKSDYADAMELEPREIFTVAISCIAKKYECRRPEMKTNGVYEVDCVLTTKELMKMLKMAGIDFSKLTAEPLDEFPEALDLHKSDIYESGGIAPPELRMATVAGLAEIKKILQQIESGACDYDLIKLAACPDKEHSLCYTGGN